MQPRRAVHIEGVEVCDGEQPRSLTPKLDATYIENVDCCLQLIVAQVGVELVRHHVVELLNGDAVVSWAKKMQEMWKVTQDQ